ncbi:MAG: alpha/beta hydrolase family protein [Acidimicrobiia bacterium]
MPTEYRYGQDRAQVAELSLPEGRGPHPVVVLVHGGFWRSAYDRSLMRPLAADLVAHGYGAWNIEYRRVGDRGGGWPGTFEDVAAAVDALATMAADVVDLDRVTSVGHSAGGHLSLWVGGRRGLPDGAPGARPRVVVAKAVSQAGVADLRAGVADGVGGRAIVDLMGARPEDAGERYELASPAQRLPLGVPQLLVHGDDDALVPVDQSVRYARAATAAGDPVELVTFPGADHFDVIDPRHLLWRAVVERLT